jgi:CBS domain-containing protein
MTSDDSVMALSPAHVPVGALAADNVMRIAAEATLFEIADLLHDNDIGALVVGTDAVTGVVSERDVVRALSERRDPATTTASELTTGQPVWCDASATVSEAAMEMADRWVRHLLIEQDGKLIGIVSARDLLGMCFGIEEVLGGDADED